MMGRNPLNSDKYEEMVDEQSVKIDDSPNVIRCLGERDRDETSMHDDNEREPLAALSLNRQHSSQHPMLKAVGQRRKNGFGKGAMIDTGVERTLQMLNLGGAKSH